MKIWWILYFNFISQVLSVNDCKYAESEFRYSHTYYLTQNEYLYVFNNKNPTFNLLWAWHQTTFRIKDILPKNVDVFVGRNLSDVVNKCQDSSQNFNLLSFIDNTYHSVFTSNDRYFVTYISPFEAKAVGIRIWDSKTLALEISTQFILINFVLSIFGVVLYMISYRLSKSMIFHFSVGMSVGLLGSLIILLFILSRLIPFRKTFMALLLMCGSIFTSMMYSIKDGIMSSLFDNFYLATAYIILVLLIVFVLIYIYYPTEVNPKVINVVNSFLKLLSFALIYISTSSFGLFCFLSMSLLLFTFFKRIDSFSWIMRFYHRLYPVRRQLIRPEVYPLVLQKNTEQELNSLRKYFQSNNMDVWKLIGTSPHLSSRLASFVETGEHISKSERESYLIDDNDDSDITDSDDARKAVDLDEKN